MKKRIVTFLMAVALTFGLAAEGIGAEPATAKEPVLAEDVTERIRLGGLKQIESHDIAEEEMPDVFEPESDDAKKGSAVYKSDWDKYSTNYYYNQLSQQQQEFWDQLDAVCLKYLTGTGNFGTIRDEGTVYYVTESVVYTNIPNEEADRILRIFMYSNPQYYFLNMGYFRSTMGIKAGRRAMTVYPAFAKGAERSKATAQMKAVIDNWMVQINAQPDDLSKEKKAHDLICEKVEYDPGYENTAIPMNEYNQVAYSVFCTDTTVCAGYSQAMQLLMNGAGIDCGVVTSFDHEWNIVRLNDSWYYTDLTWNDLPAELADKYGQGMVYDYFNRSYQYFMSDEPRLALSHTAEDIWDGLLPDLTYDSGAEGTDYGTIYTPSETLGLPRISCTGSTVTLTAPAGTIYYTTDNRDPSAAATKAKKYTGPFALTGTTTIKAVAVKNGYYDSQVAGITITPKYNVVFSANGGYIGSKSVSSVSSNGIAYNTKIGLPKDPKRKGYAFLGWYTGKSGGSKLTGAFPVRADGTYYARWAKINTKKKAAIASVKNSSAKSIKVKIKDLKTVNGYQIRYSLNKNMASAKKKEVSGTTCTINKLRKGKTYYVQARMYQKESVSGKKKYGRWSKTKTVKIKK